MHVRGRTRVHTCAGGMLEYEKATSSNGSTGGARREHSGNLKVSVGSRSLGFSTASSSSFSSTFFFDLAELATPLAVLTRTKSSSFCMSACCFS